MKLSKKVLMLIVVFGIIASITLLLSIGDTSTYYSYDKYADMEKDKTVKAASIPDFVPKSASNIRGWYNVEINEQKLEFTFTPQDLSTVIAGFTELHGMESEEMMEEIAIYSWQNFDSNNKYLIYRKSTEGERQEYLAINLEKSQAFYVAR